MGNQKETRPVLRLERTKHEWIVEGIAGLGVLSSGILLVFYWAKLPNQVPRHFDITGRPDAWAGKASVLFLPVLSLGLYVALTVIARSPHRFNYPRPITSENAETQYRLARTLVLFLKAMIVWIFAFLLWRTAETGLGRSAGLGAWFLPLTAGSLLGLVAYFSYRSARAR